MSYNTRRSSDRTPMTQVKYYQQPAGKQASNAQSTNPGYSTQQPAYQTTPPQNYSTSPAQAKVPQQPPLPSTPAPPNQPTAPPKTPVVKQEPPTPQDTPKMDVSTENGEATGDKPAWKKRPFVKLPPKVKKARQNAKLRRVLNPKNALMFLNELKPGVKFLVREETGWGYVANVEIDGKTFSGHGLSMSKAKVAASEQALKHILLLKLTKSLEAGPPPSKAFEKDEDETMEEEGEGGEPQAKRARVDPVEDDMPWGSLAAFALHKLFAEWQTPGMNEMPVAETKYEEPVVEEPYFTRRPGPPPGVFGRGRGFAPFPPRGPPPPHFRGPMLRGPPPFAVLSKPRPAFPVPGGVPLNMQPMKKLPEDANKRHPVMLLHQLKPNLVYKESQEGSHPNLVFMISVLVDGKEYFGKGKSKKEAKKNAAKEALAPLGIIYEDGQF